MAELGLEVPVEPQDIKGYRILSPEEKDLINKLKDVEAALITELRSMQGDERYANQRSLALGITNIQTGFMWAIRAIARPNGE